MDVSLLLDGLNDKQREAVAAPLGNHLVLAGAGSGKTRVLVHRIAWLLAVEQASPYSIMSVTFTNKAAAEMRGRINELMHGSSAGMWNGTFHGLCHRMLRAHYLDARLPDDFNILDSDDQMRLLRRLIKAQNLDEKHLLRSFELLRDNKHIREHYQARFKHILVDEFQDTNNIQFAWLRLMAGPDCHVMIVGDDDQSIYGWRGAQVENIQRFLNDFNNASSIFLEQNYRSTANILNAANELIANNTARMGKNLWTEDGDGEPISLYSAFNELDEARFAVGKIREWREQGGSLSDTAFLYRSNAQSRVLEEALIQAGMPYRIYGGMRFFERQEIKDALAYLRLVGNRNDDASFERVVNTPTRGLGDRTLETIRLTARDRGLTMWQSSLALLDEQVLAGRAANALQRFIELINALEDDTAELPMYQQTDDVIRHSGLRAMYEQEKGEKAQARIENLEELVTATRQFEIPEEAADMSPLSAFLAHAALEAGDGQADAFEDAVQLMTMHSAKGLEFPVVFMVGVEEGMFPSSRTIEEADRLEEERRLCYVGMTRAMKKLYITYAEMRRLYGKDNFHKPSRFIREIPEQYVEEVRMKAQVSRPVSSGRFSQTQVNNNFNETGFSLGQRVQHPKFGEGTIINFEGSGAQSRVQVAFNGEGIKWLVTQYAKLTAL
jgi:DNA helicase-2/ATP-dependent DNA helicase PcrA